MRAKKSKISQKTQQELARIMQEDDAYVPEGEFLDFTGEEDPNNPENDLFFRNKRWVERAINHARASVTPLQAECARRHAKGATFTKIASQLNIAPTTVSKNVKLKKVQRLLHLQYQYHTMLSGFTQQHKDAMLMRIAIANEQTHPSISIAAIESSNRAQNAHLDRQDKLNGFAPAQTTIIINPDTMPATALDILPPLLPEADTA